MHFNSRYKMNLNFSCQHLMMIRIDIASYKEIVITSIAAKNV
ncbi:hypothetical protein HMPREF3213_00335 [Heyndrickxia coagulans]|uniref:Uncharacterized protein n=1 Tax=Heyndrickxia coagulans TaxID=1398 RepID=A0A133L1W7_HEYCO|nr:hypothetical protein HMPREF3213_00335 [Heyndrickxia coagulans]